MTKGDIVPLMQAIYTPMIIFSVFNLVLGALFWYTPALAGFFGTRLTQSVFYSVVAFWRNKTAFIVYGLIWAAIFYAISFVFDVLFQAGVPANLLRLINVPLNVLLAAVVYSCVYPSYISVFGRDATHTHTSALQ